MVLQKGYVWQYRSPRPVSPFSAFASAEVSGYAVNESKKVTHIKWTFDESGVLTFGIDASATVIYDIAEK